MNKYGSNYSQLSHLILKMPDADQATLLEIAKKLIKGETLKPIFEIPKKALLCFTFGISAGSCLTIILIILLLKINWLNKRLSKNKLLKRLFKNGKFDYADDRWTQT